MGKKPNICHPPNIFDEIVKSKGAITLQKLFNQTAVTEITKVCLTLPDIQSGKDSFSPNRTEFHRTKKRSSFSCSGCFQPRATNFPFLVLVTQINCIYIFLNIVC